MLVSILTPSFNQKAWLRDCLRSVERQTYSHIEHIVFDGRSTDGTLDVLERASNRVRWRSESDHGQSHALNKAFTESRGEVIGWINSDDAYYSPDVVAQVVCEFERSRHLDVIYGHACLVRGDGLILQMIWTPRFNSALLRRFNFIIQPAAFIRRRALGETFVDETLHYAIDRELWLRLSGHARFSRLDQVLAIDRHHPERKSYAGHSEWDREGAILAERYDGARPLPWPVSKALRVSSRAAGIRLLGRIRQDLAFSGRVDARTRLALRQIALPRSLMSVHPVRARSGDADDS